MRMVTEADVDSMGRKAFPQPYNGYPFTYVSGGSGPIDERALTIDTEARMSPRCVGQHKGRVNSPVEHAQPSKSDSLRTLQAFRIGGHCDVDLIGSKRLCPDSPKPESRLKAEYLQGMPLSGTGADISLVCGRRIQGLEMRGREASSNQAKMNLADVSIEHQFRRRHHSCPPPTDECKRKDDFEHMLRAEAYSTLLDRPAGTMRKRRRAETVRERMLYISDGVPKEPPRITRTPRQDGFREVRLGNSTVNPVRGGGNEGDAAAGHHLQQEAASESSALAGPEHLIAALRDATRNTPAEAVWDAMLSAIADSPQLFSPQATTRGLEADDSLPAKKFIERLQMESHPVAQAVAAAAASASNSSNASNASIASPRHSPRQQMRNISPKKRAGLKYEDNPHDISSPNSPRRRLRISQKASDGASSLSSPRSAATSSTTADTMSLGFSPVSTEWSTGSQSHLVPGINLLSSARPMPNMRKTLPARTFIAQPRDAQEQWKALRRAKWVG